VSAERLSWPRRIAIAVLLSLVGVGVVMTAFGASAPMCLQPGFEPGDAAAGCALNRVPVGGYVDGLVAVCAGLPGLAGTDGGCIAGGGQYVLRDSRSFQAGDVFYSEEDSLWLDALSSGWTGTGASGGAGDSVWPQLSLEEALQIAQVTVVFWGVCWAVRLLFNSLRKGVL